MKSKGGFTKKDFIVILGCAVFALANLGAISSSGRRRAKEFVCLSNLLQWGTIFQMYCDDNNGYFFSGEFNGTRNRMGGGRYWRLCMKPYAKDKKMWLCPQATKARQEGIPVGSWTNVAWKYDDDVGSYGLNGWILNIAASKDPANRDNGWLRPDKDSQGRSRHWGTPHVKNARSVPVFTDMWWVDAWPLETDQPPLAKEGPGDTPNMNEMQRVCVNRHDGFVGGLFMDWSVRKIGLKELWTLKWHRSYNVNGPWTKAGGVRPTDWPKWMRDFPGY